MSDSHFEEQAALHAVGLLDPAAERALLQAAENDPELKRILRDFTETAALLALDAPEATPPPALRDAICRQLPAPRPRARIIPFAPLIPYAIAAGLLVLGIYQTNLIFGLNSELRSVRAQAVQVAQRDMLAELKLASLEARDASYASAKVMVAWDPKQHRGMVSMENMPAPPSGHDYQLWVLDPAAQAPISAGLLTSRVGSEGFAIRPVSTAGPGFAISVEPSGGSVTPTANAIIFAVAPGT